jgi:murein DD-endopeptidase MepM/ murein hydrolase activator NlpD
MARLFRGAVLLRGSQRVLNVKAVLAVLQDKVRGALPAREFLHYKTDVGMQVYRLSTRAQLLGVAGIASLAVYTGIATLSMVERTSSVASANTEVAAMRAELASLKAGVAAATERVERRQQFIAAVVSGTGDASELAALMPAVAAPIDPARADAMLRPLADLERAQYAFVDQATTAAEARFENTSGLLRRLGLKPARFLKQSTIGMGGPAEPLASAEPQFKALFMSWRKLDMLEKGMTAIPSMKPVKAYTYTSGYGVRYDPFTGSTAMHKGVDLAGPVGEPIYAAADGVIVEAGYHGGGYGKFVEIDHGAGIVTRYGHLSSIDVRKGDRIKRGEEIGGMGSTGRSTGSHLHYEVLIDGEQVNPMPFLEAAETVLAVQDRASSTALGGPSEPTGR